ncbi:MAG TPA: CBASS cGAMP-activated phospholipase [Alloacidobacterium sp.]|nr:CBASS cGAMP-activated phospholipase [Alloacidobacterium sp.]
MADRALANENQEFRILSIDGGGIKGVFPAAFLAELEKSLPEPIYRYFDLIAGTSTGGIIALGLGLGLSASAITSFYEKYGPSIFPAAFLSTPMRLVRQIFSSKYSPDALRIALEGEYKHSTLGDSKVRLLIPSFNVNNGEVHIYKTRHHERFRTDFRVSMVDVALATTAAPTYFPTHKGAGQALYIDGGLWANNPVGNAVVEAVSWLGISPQRMRVLSLGCTQFPASLTGLSGGRDWLRKALEVALRGQSGGSLGIAYSLVSHERVIRINPAVPANKFKLDKAKTIPELAAYGYLEARKASSDLIPLFFSEPAQPFTPLP